VSVPGVPGAGIPDGSAEAMAWGSDRYFGVYPGTVSSNQDDDHQGQVQVALPWSPDTSGGTYEVWARLATTMAGGQRGTWFIPDKGDEVLVCFGAGNPRNAYVVGALWNGKDAAPVTMDADNNVKSIVSRKGIRITLDDTDGAVVLRLQTPGGQQVTLDDAARSAKLADANGNSLELAPGKVTLTAAANLTITAGTVSISSGSGKVDSAMWNYSGVVKCDASIATTVVGSTYMPGVGNML
jgi:uncharacterized protein involved in type VI secretion and phage assembly